MSPRSLNWLRGQFGVDVFQVVGSAGSSRDRFVHYEILFGNGSSGFEWVPIIFPRSRMESTCPHRAPQTWQVRQIARLGLNRSSATRTLRYYTASLHKIRLNYTITYRSIIQAYLKYERAFSDLLQIRTLPHLKGEREKGRKREKEETEREREA